MNEPRSVSSQVEVAADPKTAFSAFTEEMNLWWVRGPINFFDSARAVAVVCEPGVGGRIIEVYDEATGEGLELARISAWHPGERLAWRSSVDDVEVEVRFEPTATDALPDLDVLIERFRVHLYTLNARRSSVLMCINDAEARTGLIARN